MASAKQVWKKAGLLVLGGALLAGLAVAAAAESGAEGAEGGHHKAFAVEHEGGFGEGLELTVQQREQLRADHIAREKKLIQWEADKKLLKLDMHSAEGQETPDLSKIESLAGKIGEIQAKIIVERAKGRQFFKSILTPEQKKKAEKYFEGHGLERHGERCEKCEDQKGEE